MKIQPLFPEPPDANTRPMGWIESPAHYLSVSTRAEAIAYRAYVNRWYESFADPNGAFAARLRSEVDVDHYQALDELFVHHLLLRRYRDIRYEEGGVGPDFRMYEDGECVAAIEVLSLFERDDWSAEKKRHFRLADAINERVPPTDGYMLNFKIEQADKEPAPRPVAEFIRRQLAQLPPHETLASQPTLGVADLPTAMYSHQGVRISMQFIPMTAGATVEDDPGLQLVVTGPVIGGTVNSGARLKDRIGAKAGTRYDIADVPFLVVAFVHDTLCTDVQVLWALYGTQSVTFPSGELLRENDGLFGLDKKYVDGRHRRVSGVAVVQDRSVLDPEVADIATFHNPFAARPWPKDAFPSSRDYGPVEVSDASIRLDWR